MTSYVRTSGILAVVGATILTVAWPQPMADACSACTAASRVPPVKNLGRISGRYMVTVDSYYLQYPYVLFWGGEVRLPRLEVMTKDGRLARFLAKRRTYSELMAAIDGVVGRRHCHEASTSAGRGDLEDAIAAAIAALYRRKRRRRVKLPAVLIYRDSSKSQCRAPKPSDPPVEGTSISLDSDYLRLVYVRSYYKRRARVVFKGGGRLDSFRLQVGAVGEAAFVSWLNQPSNHGRLLKAVNRVVSARSCKKVRKARARRALKKAITAAIVKVYKARTRKKVKISEVRLHTDCVLAGQRAGLQDLVSLERRKGRYEISISARPYAHSYLAFKGGKGQVEVPTVDLETGHRAFARFLASKRSYPKVIRALDAIIGRRSCKVARKKKGLAAVEKAVAAALVKLYRAGKRRRAPRIPTVSLTVVTPKGACP